MFAVGVSFPRMNRFLMSYQVASGKYLICLVHELHLTLGVCRLANSDWMIGPPPIDITALPNSQRIRLCRSTTTTKQNKPTDRPIRRRFPTHSILPARHTHIPSPSGHCRWARSSRTRRDMATRHRRLDARRPPTGPIPRP